MLRLGARPAVWRTGALRWASSRSGPISSPPVVRTDGDGGHRERVPVVSTPLQANYVLPESASWTSKVSNGLISTFNLDRELLRAGPIAGKVFREMCEAQAAYQEGLPMSKTAKFYYEAMDLPKSYNQFVQVTFLHAWMLFVRMRSLRRKVCKEYQQQLINGIFNDIDDYMRTKLHFKSDRAVNSYKKEFDSQLRGSIFAYDEALVEGDTVMAGALWRNVFQAKEDVSLQQLEQLTHYVRVQLYLLDKLSDDDFTHARFKFIQPWGRYDTQVVRDPQLEQGQAQSEPSAQA